MRTGYGPWAVITGASSGIGRELALRIAEAGLNIAVVARRRKLLDELAAEAESNYGVESLVIEADLGDADGISAVCGATGHLEIGLFVAAAGFGTSGELLKSSVAVEMNMLQVNCAALLALTHHFGRLMVARKRGGIILLSSLVGFQGVPYAAHYAATKAYVQSLGEALYLELKGEGIDVLSAAPGPVNSGFASRAGMQMGKALTPADIGGPILKALGRRSTVLPGFMTKFLVGSLRLLPRWGKVRVMRAVMGGFTKHQRAAPN
ncbi:MAG: SDR family NAD(P)-dependent oxidoreductase [Bacteroidota bacterium]